MKLYVLDGQIPTVREVMRNPNLSSPKLPNFRVATLAELLEAARPHADLEAAGRRLHYALGGAYGNWECGTGGGDPQFPDCSCIEDAKGVVLAALGADGE